MEQQNPIDTHSAKSKRRPFLKGILAGGLIGSLLAGGAAAFANSEHHSNFWKTGGCHKKHSMRDPSAMKERADFMAERMLDRIDATPEQRTQVKATLQTSIDELLKLRDQHHANREATLAALTQPTVDRAELERVRSAEMQLAERASATLMATLADIAEALDPEQRKKISEMAAHWTGRRHGV